MKKKKVQKKKLLKTRDHLMVKVINGATKAGVHTDRKKQADKYACRGTKLAPQTGETDG